MEGEGGAGAYLTLILPSYELVKKKKKNQQKNTHFWNRYRDVNPVPMKLKADILDTVRLRLMFRVFWWHHDQQWCWPLNLPHRMMGNLSSDLSLVGHIYMSGRDMAKVISLISSWSSGLKEVVKWIGLTWPLFHMFCS